MTQPVNLEVVEVHLVSILLPSGVTLPAPLVVLPDETPLYNEPIVLAELEASIVEDRVAKVDVEITHLEPFSSTLITATFGREDFESSYRVNIPRSLLQVGRMYNSVLNAPAVSILTLSEMGGYDPDNVLERVAPIFSDDVIIRMFFPVEPTSELTAEFNQVLNHSNIDFLDGANVKDIMKMVSKVTVTVSSIELSEIRAELVDIIISLINGSEDALVSLYEYAEAIDSALEAVENSTPLSDDERVALIIYECLGKLYVETSPNALVSQIVEEAEIDEINIFQHVIEESGMDLNGIFNNVLTEHYEVHPEALSIGEHSTQQERVDYLMKDTNTIPLLGGLFSLSDRINVDLLYSRDWNNSNVTEEDYVSKGEYAIILALLISQRIQMFAKVLDSDSPEEVNLLAMTMLIQDLSTEGESDIWVLIEGLKRMVVTQPLVFNEFLHLSIEGADHENKVYSPFGALLHRFGHAIIEEEWGYGSMMIAFEKLPLIKEFVSTLFSEYEDLKDSSHDHDEEEECYSLNATLHVIEHQEQLKNIIKQLGEALTILAELNVMRSENHKKDSDEWFTSIRQYLTGIAESV